MISTIPQTIHQIWIGPNAPPPKVIECMHSVISVFNTFNYILWHNDNIPIMPHNVQNQFNKYKNMNIPAFQADILRLYVLNMYGGILIDADFYISKNFMDEIKKPFWTVAANSKTKRHVYNGLFACEPNNPILNNMLDTMNDEPFHKNLPYHGPLFFSKHIRTFANIPDNYNIYNYLQKYPHDYVQCDSHVLYQNNFFAKHFFLGSSKTTFSWKKQLCKKK